MLRRLLSSSIATLVFSLVMPTGVAAAAPGRLGSAPAVQPVACRIAVGAVFSVPTIGTALFNKEPILLMNRSLKKIPPVDDPNGQAMLFKLPLFSVADPHAEPVAFLTSLRYGADNYLTEDEVRGIRERARPQSV